MASNVAGPKLYRACVGCSGESRSKEDDRTQHYGRSPAFPWRGMAANPSRYDPEACVFNTEETYWVQRQSGWLYLLLSQGADQRWNKVWQVKMNSQCLNDEIKLLIFLFCLSVVSLLRKAVQWNSVVSTWRFSFILMQRSRDDGVSCLRFAGRWHFLCYDLHVLKLTLITLNSLWNNFGHVLMIEICSVLSGSDCWRMWYTSYENRPHQRHFTVHCLQWSITFLTEYISTRIDRSRQIKSCSADNFTSD